MLHVNADRIRERICQKSIAISVGDAYISDDTAEHRPSGLIIHYTCICTAHSLKQNAHSKPLRTSLTATQQSSPGYIFRREQGEQFLRCFSYFPHGNRGVTEFEFTIKRHRHSSSLPSPASSTGKVAFILTIRCLSFSMTSKIIPLHIIFSCR